MSHYPTLGRTVAGLMLLAAAGGAAAAGLWSEANAPLRLDGNGPQPANYRSLLLDVPAVTAALDEAVASGTPFPLPRPDGSYAAFVLEDSGTLSPELAAKFPELRSLRGRDADGNRLRLDMSVLGLQALVFDQDGSWVVQPGTLGLGPDYLAFRRSDAAASGRFRCDVHGRDETPGEHVRNSPQPNTVTGANRRVLRIAVAATGEYTAFFGGTVNAGQAAIAAAVNRVNEVYGNEFSVTLQLVANNNLVVYTNSGTDPYTNNSGSTMLGQNQTNLDSVIGNANYDLGHVFSTGGGGVATLNSVCSNSTKARGVTGSGAPTGDPFWIDYVAHEMGHQFGGSHTFNSETSSCGGGNRSGGAAYETGSGSTIQAYAGICGSDDLQPNSDPYFHAKSLEQMQARLDAVPSCGSSTPNPSSAPVIPAMTTSYAIPARTPFRLIGPVATDADGDSLSYAWEEYDLGVSTPINVDNGSSPIIRSFNPTASRQRMVPRLSALLSNANLPGEILPQVDRTALRFRLTVRDNHAGGGRSSSADMPAIRVVGSSGPFQVTTPNTALNWAAGIPHTVTWDVANTTAAPISCASVAIDISSDGGASWAAVLRSATPNDGSENVVIPGALTGSQARIRVRCPDNIFFDISNVNFSVSASNDGIFYDSFETR
ncbi:reprolysin-like metallopeptidase [Tahibacter harae]|uniref:M12 family metallo-peptidase n=1 Tax=Tahibacter harae TaxID=2963937 RepID=A0ABT1QPU6_9GAMM|nr:zinc-dependent metalloprotease family protein [Tahibacter harae]MCQ4164304.1 M12 family metallo-peptidase [Tahibacter harae]